MMQVYQESQENQDLLGLEGWKERLVGSLEARSTPDGEEKRVQQLPQLLNCILVWNVLIIEVQTKTLPKEPTGNAFTAFFFFFFLSKSNCQLTVFNRYLCSLNER